MLVKVLSAILSLLAGGTITHGSAEPAPPADPYAAARARQEDVKKGVHIEIYKALINNSFDYIRNTTQALQTVTGLFLTAYVALLVGFRRDLGFSDIRSLISALLPAAMWIASLAVMLLTAMRYRGFDLAILGLDHAMNTYAETLKARRRHLRLPALLTTAGIVAFMCVYTSVFVKRPAAKAGTTTTGTKSP